VLITAKFSKEGCISLAVGGRPFHIAHKHDWNRNGSPLTWESNSSKTSPSKIRNLDHKSKAIRTQLPRKANGAQPSIERRPIRLNDIGNWAWHLPKRP
jgi:hypothetical protein